MENFYKNKFQIGDILHILDENDSYYKEHSLYKVVDFSEKGYTLLSLKSKTIHSPILINIMAALCSKNGIDFVNTFYRIATSQEIVLYGSE